MKNSLLQNETKLTGKVMVQYPTNNRNGFDLNKQSCNQHHEHDNWSDEHQQNPRRVGKITIHSRLVIHLHIQPKNVTEETTNPT